jgi:hypothetical protein
MLFVVSAWSVVQVLAIALNPFSEGLQSLAKHTKAQAVGTKAWRHGSHCATPSRCIRALFWRHGSHSGTLSLSPNCMCGHSSHRSIALLCVVVQAGLLAKLKLHRMLALAIIEQFKGREKVSDPCLTQCTDPRADRAH